MIRLILCAVLVAACGTVVPAATSVPPTAAPTAAPTVAVTPAPVATATLAPPAATPAPPAPCDPVYEQCDPRYTPRGTAAASTPEPVGDELVVALSPTGTYLVDEAGMTLYIFDRDGPNSSDCTSNDCLSSWPPLLLAPEQAAVAGDGVTGQLSGFDRSDGDVQVSYDSMPLYYYAGDSAPGDTNGDGIGGVWHLAAP